MLYQRIRNSAEHEGPGGRIGKWWERGSRGYMYLGKSFSDVWDYDQIGDLIGYRKVHVLQTTPYTESLCIYCEDVECSSHYRQP